MTRKGCDIKVKMPVIKTFEKSTILPAQLNPYLIFNRGSRPRKAKILTRGIH
jgi:hypothetical protein